MQLRKNIDDMYIFILNIYDIFYKIIYIYIINK